VFSLAGEDGKAERIETEELLADDAVQQTDRITLDINNQRDIEAHEALGSSPLDNAADSDKLKDAGHLHVGSVAADTVERKNAKNAEAHHIGSLAAHNADSNELEDVENVSNCNDD